MARDVLVLLCLFLLVAAGVCRGETIRSGTFKIGGSAALVVDGTADFSGADLTLPSVGTSGTYTAVVTDTAGRVVSGTNAAESAMAWIVAAGTTASGSNAGAMSATTWVTRELNFLAVDTGSIAAIGTNAVIVPPGVYRVRASAPALGVNFHQARLTQGGTSVLLVGTSMQTNPNYGDQTRSEVIGLVTLSATAALSVEHYSSGGSGNGDALGHAAGAGGPETYTVLELWKE